MKSSEVFIIEASSIEPHVNKIFKIFLAIDIAIMTGFFFMVSSLLCFHTYLASKNLTTCNTFVTKLVGEFLSWMKISYMKVWPKRYGSPFSKGSTRSNLNLYFCHSFSRAKSIYLWKMPNKQPKLKI